MPRVRVVVSDDKKERWKEFVEETPEYDSVSDLVRKSVETTINSGTGDQEGEYEELYQILDTVESIETKQSRIQDSIDAHRQNALTESDLDQLENVVVEALWDFSDMIRDVEGNDEE